MAAASQIVDQLRQLVLSDDGSDHMSAHMRATALVAQLKASNRSSNSATRTARQKTDHARHEMDQSHLGLQNLFSVYQDVPLHSLDDFKVLAPGAARTPEALENEHQLMLNRLSFELAERDRLDKLRKSLASQKDKLLVASKTKAVTMDNVKTQIDNLMKNASDIQRKIDDLVETLPPAAPESSSP